MNLDHRLHHQHDQKQQESVLLLHGGSSVHDHIPSSERRNSLELNLKFSHHSCYEREQRTACELQKLRDAYGALKLEKDKEIAFLRDQLAMYTSLSKSPLRALPPAIPSTTSGVQSSLVPTTTSTSSSHVIVPAIYSVTSKGVVRTVRLDRQASLKTARVLATMPRDQAKGVADRVAAAFADPVLSLPYLHSIQFGADLVELSAQVSNLLEAEARCLSISSPVYVFGDIHGNFTDLRFFADNMWHLGMGVTPGSFLFLGDYVDRGQSSLECIAYLFAQKVLHPKKLFLLRGNHETRAINGLEAHYGPGCFLSQCKARFGNEEGYIVWHQVNHAFDRLPLAAAIDNDIFCVHGGIPRSVGNEKILDSIHKIPSKALLDVLDMKYYEENSQISMVSDMLWGDPVLEEMESSLDGKGFGKSVRGGVAVSFGEKAIENFLQQSKFSRILRAHEAKVDGVAVSKSARIITVFSTSKDHGLGEDAKCGCLLIDNGKIISINQSPQAAKNLQLSRRRSTSYQSDLRLPVMPPALQFGSGGNATGAPGSYCTIASCNVPSSAAQHEEERAVEAVQLPLSDTAINHDDGSDSTDDEEDPPPPPMRHPSARSPSRSTPSTVDTTTQRGTVQDGMRSRLTLRIPSNVVSTASPASFTSHRTENDDDEEDNNQHDDI